MPPVTTGTRSSKPMCGRTSVGSPCGSAPSTATPACASTRETATNTVAATTAIRMPGDARVAFQHQDQRERARADGQRHVVRPARGDLPARCPRLVRNGPVRVDGKAEQLRDLAQQHGQRDAVHVAVADRLREQLGDEAEPREARGDANEAGYDRHRTRQRDGALRIACRQRQDDGQDHGRERGIRTEHENAARTEQRIGEQRNDRRVEAVDAGHARRLGIGDADRHEHRREHEAGQDVAASARAVRSCAGFAAPEASASIASRRSSRCGTIPRAPCFARERHERPDAIRSLRAPPPTLCTESVAC